MSCILRLTPQNEKTLFMLYYNHLLSTFPQQHMTDPYTGWKTIYQLVKNFYLAPSAIIDGLNSYIDQSTFANETNGDGHGSRKRKRDLHDDGETERTE
jgi:hypothetical protein